MGGVPLGGDEACMQIGRKKKRNSFLLGAGLVLGAVAVVSLPRAFALPSGEVVKSGTVEFRRSGNELRVLQETGKAIVNYQSFNIGSSDVATTRSSSTPLATRRDTGQARCCSPRQVRRMMWRK